MTPIFITGTGTNVGKTIVSVIIANALQADYWKPVQAGTDNGTDSEWVKKLCVHSSVRVHPETYKLKLAVSPHIAAREEEVEIDLEKIASQRPMTIGHLIIEGAGGLLVPLNHHEMVIDLICKLNAKVIIVSRNYLGSINHSLLTAEVCRQRGLDVLGWIFNDDYMEYQEEIAGWSGYTVIGQIPRLEEISSNTLFEQSVILKTQLLRIIEFNSS